MIFHIHIYIPPYNRLNEREHMKNNPIKKIGKKFWDVLPLNTLKFLPFSHAKI